MRQVWMFAAAAVLASLASPARADEPPTPPAPPAPAAPAEAAPAGQVTYYLELGTLSREQSEGLVALLKREFPTAQVELIDGTLRVQADGATFEAVGKVLEAQRRHDLAAGGKKERAPADGDKKEKERARKEHGDAKRAEEPAAGAAKRLKLKVGDLCEGCADCLAAALTQQFPGMRFLPEETVVTVVGGGPEDLAAVEAWVAQARAKHLAAHRTTGEAHEGMESEETLVVVDDGKGPRIVQDDGTILIEGPDGKEARILLKGGRPANPRPVKVPEPPSIEELEKRLARAREEGGEAAIDKAERALEAARAARRKAPRGDLPPLPDLEPMRERIERLRERLPEGREALGDLKARFEELRMRLEREHGAAGRRPAPRERPPAQGPMAEWRQRLAHLKQAAEHLTAAGYEGLAKQVAEALKGAAAQAEEAARKQRAEQEAREAEQKRRADAERAEREAAQAREKQAREGGERRPADGRAVEELTDLVRALKRQVEELKKQVQALSERAAK